MVKQSLNKVSTDQLVSELQKRRRRLPSLERKRNRLQQELEEIDRQLEALGAEVEHGNGGRTRGRKKTGRRRATGQPALTDVLEQVLREHGTLSIEQIMDAVQQAGYESQSKQFRTIVANTLSRDPRFQRVQRGQYKLAK